MTRRQKTQRRRRVPTWNEIAHVVSQMPAPATPEEKEIWNWLGLYEFGKILKPGGVREHVNALEPIRDRAHFEDHILRRTGVDLSQNKTWLRLTSDAAMRDRAKRRDLVERTLAKMV